MTKTLFLHLCILIAIATQAQQLNIDSLLVISKNGKEDTSQVTTHLLLARQYRLIKNFKEALLHANAALAIATKFKYPDGASLAYMFIGRIYFTQNHNDPAVMNSYLSALKIAQQSGNKKQAADYYLVMAKADFDQDNYAEGLKNGFSALKIMEELNDKQGISNAYNQIGFLYYSEHNWPEALLYYQKNLVLSEEMHDSSNMVDALGKSADIYLHNHENSKAVANYERAILISTKTGDRAGAANTQAGMGDMYRSMGILASADNDTGTANMYFNKAIKTYFTAADIYRELHYLSGLVYTYVPAAQVMMRMKEYKAAKAYVDTSITLAKETGLKDDIIESYLGLYKLDSATGDYQKAFADYRTYILYRDSLNNGSIEKKSLAYSLQYEQGKKDALLRIEQERKDARSRLIRNMLYGVTGFFLMIALFLFWNNRQKQQSKIKIEKAYGELKATQAQLIQSEKMASLGELTAGIAHEIQNPLNFVNNFSEISAELVQEMEDELRNAHIDDALLIANDIKENLNKINHHGKRADAIVKGMLQHSRSGSGEKSEVKLNKMVDEYLRLAFQGYRGKDRDFNASIKTDFDETLKPISIVPQDIGRVLLNLFNNAFYAVKEKSKRGVAGYDPTITVMTRKNGSKVLIAISDNGDGIPKAIVEKIFQPFFTTKPTGEGTGLGLSLSYDIVKAHGGELKVFSQENEGSTFSMILPV